jgi:hypothetical protein
MEKLKYPHKPIFSNQKLALYLGVDEIRLRDIANTSDEYFSLVPQTKKDGSIRDCYSLNNPLKIVHKKIKNKITSKVEYPPYIQGSIKNRSNLTNARLHEGSKEIIQLDIKDFYPSIKGRYIHNIWRRFFNFSQEVSSLLTSLITLNNNLVQGSPISSDIANLIFWDYEPMLAKELQSKNLVYSRYVDDINISSKNKLPDELKTYIIKSVHAMLKAKELKLKNNKTKLLTNSSELLVTGLVVNKKAKANRQYVNNVYQEIGTNQNINSINGKINYVRQTNPKKASHLDKIKNRHKEV